MNYSIFTKLQEEAYCKQKEETDQVYMERIFRTCFREEGKEGEKQITELLGLSFESCSWEEKKLILKGNARDYLLNPAGTLQGGIMLSAADATISLLIRFVNQTFHTPTIHFSIDFMRGIMKEDDYFIHAKIAKLGRRIIFVGAELYTKEGKLAATCTGTFAA